MLLISLMFKLYRTRQALTELQLRIRTDAVLLGHAGEALASVSESERVLADLQQQITAVRADIGKP